MDIEVVVKKHLDVPSWKIKDHSRKDMAADMFNKPLGGMARARWLCEILEMKDAVSEANSP